jgi:hypothetical protein
LSERRASTTGAGGGGLVGEIGGEATLGGATSRAGTTPEEAAGMGAAGFTGRESLSFPLRLPNTTTLQAGQLLAPQFLDQW